MDGMLENAKQNRETLEMIYLSKDGQLSQRNIRILNAGEAYILAYCYNRKKVRKFNRSSILSIGPIRKKVG
ncbi:hypothetical protein N780_13460 [Pontibacillus chungwhensis BH030062]|uniref:WYL domain-containing protein n=1 Tax=Pontibacillus chungwhensis BH030062 TaxID=1385513 RepID=A0A0A2UWY1_9BACI|nr:hypothetical protein [Pontibacillus chungwhensis]KGP92414.1 hypothetical protein N780_13460 [Pontibacillus chungwhensis BH030062]